MNNIMNAIILSFKYIYSVRSKILIGLILILTFVFLLFPLKDLNNYASSLVLEFTQKNTYIQFEDLYINPATASINFDKLSIDQSGLNEIVIDHLQFSPSLKALVKRLPGGKINAEGLFNGNLQTSFIPLEKLESNAVKYEITLNSQSISLNELRDTLKMSTVFSGTADLSAHLTADTDVSVQPDGDVTLTINNFAMPSFAIPLAQMGGDIVMPEIKFKQIDLKGKLSGGKFTFESVKIGTTNDELFGTITGHIDLSLTKGTQGIKPNYGGYNLTFDLTAKPNFEEKARLFLMFFESFKSPGKSGNVYKFKLSANNFMSFPSPARP